MDTRLLIRGERVQGEGPPLEVENPATEEAVASVGTPSPEQLDAAIAGAREAFADWSRMPPVERCELLTKIAPKEWWYPYGS
jgi:aldehyde dehydrogenase (NAD+)